MNVLDALKAAQEIGAGQRITPASDGVLILESMKFATGFKGPRFVFEFFVESATGPKANAPGSHVSDVYVLNGDEGKVKSKLSRVKGVLGALGVDESEIAGVFEDAQKGGQMLRGVRVKFAAWEDTDNVKPGKEPFVLKQFSRIEHTPEMVANGRAVLNGGK